MEWEGSDSSDKETEQYATSLITLIHRPFDSRLESAAPFYPRPHSN